MIFFNSVANIFFVPIDVVIVATATKTKTSLSSTFVESLMIILVPDSQVEVGYTMQIDEFLTHHSPILGYFPTHCVAGYLHSSIFCDFMGSSGEHESKK